MSACAQSGYDAQKLQSQLEDAGATPAQARCATNGLEAKFDLNELASHSDPTPQEMATVRAILHACTIKVTPTTSTPSS